MVDAEGERTFLVCSRAAAHTTLRTEEIDPHTIANAAWLHTSGTSLTEAPSRDAILHAMTLARGFGVPVSLDVNVHRRDAALSPPFCAAVEKAITLADMVLGSAEEVASFAPAVTIEASAQTLAGDERTVIARLGSQGALAVSSTGIVSVPAFPTRIVDTVGAGDAFDAGFIAARAAGTDIETALRWGNAAAALKIARPGARGLPSRAEVEELLHG
jgi:fructokinase/2-dehydro-3-deoxygluconokinase